MTTAEALANLPVLRCLVAPATGRRGVYYRAVSLDIRTMGTGDTPDEACGSLWVALSYAFKSHAEGGTMGELVERPTIWQLLSYYVHAINGWLTRRRLTWKIRSSYTPQDAVQDDMLELRSGPTVGTRLECCGENTWLLRDVHGGSVVGLVMYGLAKREEAS